MYKNEIVCIGNKPYKCLGVFGGYGYYSDPNDIGNNVILQGIIWALGINQC